MTRPGAARTSDATVACGWTSVAASQSDLGGEPVDATPVLGRADANRVVGVEIGQPVHRAEHRCAPTLHPLPRPRTVVQEPDELKGRATRR